MKLTTRNRLTGMAVIYDGKDDNCSLRVVESKLSDTHYMLRLYNFNKLTALDERCVVSIDDMTSHTLEMPQWHFFESIEAASNWFEMMNTAPEKSYRRKGV